MIFLRFIRRGTHRGAIQTPDRFKQANDIVENQCCKNGSDHRFDIQTDPCQHCKPCRSGLLHLCENQLTPGLSCDGGYAEYVVIRHTALIAIPSVLSSVHAAPILCTGTFPGLSSSLLSDMRPCL
ncbi:alcohol dehydrogenase catalytic domain-containing protein [Klebsiella variicola]|uniref:alcohol dehydrogenase catalytic domain-containing protein n=1 Tax=Klebsiella variicola TaxID=244366 RepID=UPI003DA42B35